jgi:hypothetical protein
VNRVPVRLVVVGAGLALVFGVAAALGSVVHPGRPAATCDTMRATSSMGPQVLGVAVSQDGLTITPAASAMTAGRMRQLRLRVVDRTGAPVRSGYQLEAQRLLHLIVVRRDLTGYQHLHPRMSRDGTWSAPLTVSQPGAYRAFADFQLECQKYVLAADVIAPGTFQPSRLPAPSDVSRIDGYEVRLRTPVLRAGQHARLSFRVSRHGRPVRALQPYLGARGHLVALRQGDLAYLHVHPENADAAADLILFGAEFPSAGAYRLFLQFQVGGKVHTARYTVRVAA